MTKRLAHLDTLGEVRRALRILRRVERWLVQTERDQKRRDKRMADLYEGRALIREHQGRQRAREE